MNDYTIENHVIGIQRFRIGKRTILVGRRLYHLPDFAECAEAGAEICPPIRAFLHSGPPSKHLSYRDACDDIRISLPRDSASIHFSK
jgi:hypothetical protein